MLYLIWHKNANENNNEISLHAKQSPKSGTLTTPNAGEHVEKQELRYIAAGNVKLLQPLCKAFCQFLTKLDLLLSCNPTNMLIGIYTKVLKTYVSTETCRWMFIAVLFIIAKTWKQLYSSVSQWINEMWFIQTMEHYSVLRKKDL